MTEDWSYEKAKIARDERRDKREKGLYAWIAFLVALVIAAIIVAIFLGGNRAADRSQEFRMACLESGGTVRMGECWGSVIAKEDS